MKAALRVPTIWSVFGWKRYSVPPSACDKHPDDPIHTLWLRGIELHELPHAIAANMTHRSDVKLTIVLDIH
jgi:hypothetical protein